MMIGRKGHFDRLSDHKTKVASVSSVTISRQVAEVAEVAEPVEAVEAVEAHQTYPKQASLPSLFIGFFRNTVFLIGRAGKEVGDIGKNGFTKVHPSGKTGLSPAEFH